jgi:cytoskeletal protein CcmA (bactofilin family)
MWRKQDQPKPSTAAPEAAAMPAVEHRTPAAPPIPEGAAQKPPAVLPSSRLTSSLIVKGEITGTEDLFIDARVEGSVHLVGATTVVGPNARVTANIVANQVVVEGNHEGNLQAADRVRIGATGKTKGTISAKRISVDDGAEIHGSVELRRDAEPAQRTVIPTTEDAAVPMAVKSPPSLSKEPSAAA